jgi:hypothetical protein
VERRHLSRPVYEGLPWFYSGFGVLALVASYLLAAHGILSSAMGLPGLAALLYGMVIMLKRRDYRAMRAQYGDPGSISDLDPN